MKTFQWPHLCFVAVLSAFVTSALWWNGITMAVSHKFEEQQSIGYKSGYADAKEASRSTIDKLRYQGVRMMSQLDSIGEEPDLLETRLESKRVLPVHAD